MDGKNAYVQMLGHTCGNCLISCFSYKSNDSTSHCLNKVGTACILLCASHTDVTLLSPYNIHDCGDSYIYSVSNPVPQAAVEAAGFLCFWMEGED